mgnify:FL=1
MIDGLSIIISSPSGAGKTTITKKILKKIKKSYLSVSCTTRKPRDGERNGVDYFFISKKKFLHLKRNNKFLEFAKVYENFYGTLKSQVKSNLKSKNVVLFDVDWQGARSIKKKIKKNCYSIFLLPPSIETLKKRLLLRHKNDPKTAIKRFASAKKDISHWKEYDFVFINENLNECVNSIFKKIQILNEEIKRMKLVYKKIEKL